ncbi:MAG: tetratricopeptide repeat protein [Prevotella sp.]|nr:tetratricopeptide repeat protein [Prevotella sp.]
MRKILLYMFLLVAVTAQAQTDRQCIRQGNRLYHQKQWAQAEVEYRKALSKNAGNPQALYNLGCALMMQQKDSAAIVQYQKAAQAETNKLRRSKANHNIGVICQNHRMYGEAIKAYQQSLRDNPSDDETRYNLALCKQQNKNQQQNQQNQDKDKNQDKQKQDQKQNENKDKNKEQQQQEQKEQMSKDNAEQLLNAAIQNEKATQQRMKKAMQQPQRRNVQKNW